MAELDKAIAGIKVCDMNADGNACKVCPYRETDWNGAWQWVDTNKHCYDELRNDVLELLQGQKNKTAGDNKIPLKW